jgi:voltage-gated potassium channel
MRLREKIYKVVEPKNDGYSSKAYDIVMLMAIVIGIIPLMFRTQYKIFWFFDLFSGLCFIIDYILRWCTADFESKRKKEIAFLIYPFTPMAIIDLLSILPVFNLLGPTFKVFRVSRLLIILRIFKIIRYFEPLQIIISVIRKQSSILLTVLSLALFYIFITALIMFNAEEQIHPVTGQLLFEDFFDAFYWAACTLTTVGYGDLYPISDIGRTISIISSVVGIAIIALPSGIVTAGYMNELKQRKKVNEKDYKENKYVP